MAVRKGLAVAIDGNGANIAFNEFEGVVMLVRDRFENAASLAQNFRADAITRQKRDLCFHEEAATDAAGRIRKPNPCLRRFSFLSAIFKKSGIARSSSSRESA